MTLIERIEAAEVGSRELDGAVWFALFEPDVDYGYLHVEQTEQGPREALTCELGSKWADGVGAYTTSIDAAVALAGRVLGHDGIGLCRTANGWEAWVGGREAYLTSYPTPALALVAAILRAKTTPDPPKEEG